MKKMSDKIKEVENKLRTLFSLWIDPEKVAKLEIQGNVDERGLLVEITGPKEVLSLIIGKKGSTINAVRKITKSIGGAMGAVISLKVNTPRA
jgi:predicted RNA-binding protein YlqC (UPF0109 family)